MTCEGTGRPVRLTFGGVVRSEGSGGKSAVVASASLERAMEEVAQPDKLRVASAACALRDLVRGNIAKVVLGFVLERFKLSERVGSSLYKAKGGGVHGAPARPHRDAPAPGDPTEHDLGA